MCSLWGYDTWLSCDHRAFPSTGLVLSSKLIYIATGVILKLHAYCYFKLASSKKVTYQKKEKMVRISKRRYYICKDEIRDLNGSQRNQTHSASTCITLQFMVLHRIG